ncbi:MAG: acyl--CoA ligase [Clostridia bacterium]|nr:acyl--CoA ligase [Clostridia bacterium]
MSDEQNTNQVNEQTVSDAVDTAAEKTEEIAAAVPETPAASEPETPAAAVPEAPAAAAPEAPAAAKAAKPAAAKAAKPAPAKAAKPAAAKAAKPAAAKAAKPAPAKAAKPAPAKAAKPAAAKAAAKPASKPAARTAKAPTAKTAPNNPEPADPLTARIESGEIIEQKSWQFIKELNSQTEAQLNAVAIVQGKREFTYRQMFRMWERYAEVFSALNITEKRRSRVVLITTPDAKAVFMIYALNMLGVSVSVANFGDLLDEELWENLIKKEGITDAVLCAQWVQPSVMERVLESKKRLGLRNIIVYQTPSGDPFAPQGYDFLNAVNYLRLKRRFDVLFMEELLKKYEATPIAYGSGKNDDTAVIIHSSGTTSGVHKPIPLSDRGFNESVARLLRDKRFAQLRGKSVSCLSFDLSYSYGLVDMVHLPLSFGGKLVTIPLGDLNPRFSQALEYYGVSIYFGNTWTMEKMMLSLPQPDLSAFAFVFVGGAYYSAETKKRYDEFIKKCGAKTRTINGYGISEAGAACIVSDPSRDDDSIGRPLSGVKVKIYDEDEKKYYDLKDGPRTGVLFIASPSVSCGKIGSKVFFKLEKIDGEQYLNTYDMVKVNEDGTLAYVGRMNKYFVNNEGIRFDAGLVETAVSAQPGIESCALAPSYDKILHDSFPVLYVKTIGDQLQSLNTVRQALYNVFIRDGKIKDTNLPGQCVITEDIPYTATGKVDVHRILKGENKGTCYVVTPIRVQGRLVDVRLELADLRLVTLTGVPDEIEDKFKKALAAMYPLQKNATKKSSGKSFGPSSQVAFSQGVFSQAGIDLKEVFDLLWSIIPCQSQDPDKNGMPPLTYEDITRMFTQFMQYLSPVIWQVPFVQLKDQSSQLQDQLQKQAAQWQAQAAQLQAQLQKQLQAEMQSQAIYMQNQAVQIQSQAAQMQAQLQQMMQSQAVYMQNQAAQMQAQLQNQLTQLQAQQPQWFPFAPPMMPFAQPQAEGDAQQAQPPIAGTVLDLLARLFNAASGDLAYMD